MRWIIFSYCFKNFLLAFVFSIFIVIYLVMGVFVFIVLRFCYMSWECRLIFFIGVKNIFWLLIYWIFFWKKIFFHLEISLYNWSLGRERRESPILLAYFPGKEILQHVARVNEKWRRPFPLGVKPYSKTGRRGDKTLPSLWGRASGTWI